MEEIVNTFWQSAVVMGIYMTMWFLVAWVSRRNDLADIAWGIGFIVVTLFSLQQFGSFTPLQTLLAVVVTLWGVRLALHIGTRFAKKEDFRYANWRKEWGKWVVLRSYGQVFLLQGCILLVVATPMMIANTTDTSNSLAWNSLLGLVIWALGFFFEAIGDLQLRLFIKNPNNKGKIMTEGLWQYTRHPNYFGEVTQWWGVFVMMVHLPFGWLGIVGPLMISFMILKVSGIPMLEKKYDDNAEFQMYKKQTSAFFPLPKKRV